MFYMRAAVPAFLAVQILGMPAGLAEDVGRDTATAMTKRQPAIGTGVASPVPKPTNAKLRRMWMRGGVLLVKGPGSGKTTVGVPDPVQVDVRDDQSVEIVGPNGQRLEGQIPAASDLQEMGYRNVFPGLGLFAQAETSVLLDPDGPSVGRALDGAFVPIRNVEGAWARVDLPWVERATNERDPADLQRREELTRSKEPFWVSLTDLGLDRHPLQTIRRDEIWLSRRWRTLRLAAERASPVFAIARCMPARVVETRAIHGSRAQRVAFRFEGIETRGWAEKPFPGEDHDSRCNRAILRISTESASGSALDGPRLPAGFRPAQPFPDQPELPDSIIEVFQPGKLLFVPVLGAKRLECVPYRVTKDKDRKYARGFVRAKPPTPDVLRLEYTLGLQSNGLTVFGPSTDYKNGRAIYAACAHALRFVQVHGDRLEMIGGQDEPVAYHPDDLEIWYQNRRTCMKEATPLQVSTACQ